MMQHRRPDKEKKLVFLATAEDFSEGISFRNVRRIILADLSPGMAKPNWTQIKQRVGRALRACSHIQLVPDERQLLIDLFVATHSNPRFPPTIDQEKLEMVHHHMEDIEKGMRRLRDISIDADYYNENPPPAVGPPTPSPADSAVTPTIDPAPKNKRRDSGVVGSGGVNRCCIM